jgi:hypothetical protein
MRGARAAIVALLVALGVILAMQAASPAHAATLPIQFSTNGTVWQTAPLSSVYPGGYIIVPGGTLSSTIYLRSTDPNPAAMTVAVRDVTTSNAALGANLTLSSSPSVGAGLAPTPFSSIPNCTIVSQRNVVTTGQVVSVTLTTTLSSALTGQNATLSNAAFNVVVGMSDPAVNVGVAGCPGGGAVIPATPTPPSTPAGTAGPGVVAMTGSDLLYPSLVVAGVALGVGWILVMVGKRRRRQEEKRA